MLNRRILIFVIAVLSYSTVAFPQEKLTLDLEPLVITKSKIYFLKPYSLQSDTLKDLAVDSIVEALSHLPLDLQSRSPKAGIQTDFSLRGSNFQGVLVLLNGQRINDPQTGHHNCDIPLTRLDIEKIDLIPGVGSSVFGPDAIGGAINFISKKPQDKKLILESSGGQYKTWGNLFSISRKIKDLGLRLSVENQESGGFYTDTDFKKFTATLSASYELPDGEFNLISGYLEKEFGAYDFYTPGLGYLSKEWTKTYLLNAGLNLDKQGFIIRPNFLWRRHFDKFMLDKTLQRSRYLNHHRTNVYTPNIYFQKEFGILGRMGLGLEYGEERINSTNLGKHSRNHKSMFMDEAKDLSDKLALGLSFRTDDFDGFGKVYAGSLSTRYKFSETKSLHWGVSRSMRIPSFTELYYKDPTTQGSPDLSAEKTWNYQMGYDYKQEKLSLGVTLFFRKEKDFIDWIKRSSSQAKWEVQNIAEAGVLGLENYFKYNINQYIGLESNYTYINKRIDERGYLYKYGPNYAKHLFNSTFIFNLPFGIQTIGLTYKKKPLRDGWFLLDMLLSRNLNKDTQIFLKATNLFNSEYQEIEGIPQPGRWVEAGIRLGW
jgi:iron complex outermembrane receptor protein